MPALTIERDLDRLLAESRGAGRYQDLAIHLRRLTLAAAAPPPAGERLRSADGTEWIAGPRADDGLQPVSTERPGHSARYKDGVALTWAGGHATLRAEPILRAGGRWDKLQRDWQRGPDGGRAPALGPVLLDLRESQIEAACWFAERLRAFRDRLPHPQAVGELFDDRRGGKTWLGIILLLCACIDVPSLDGGPLITWAVSLSHASRDELDQYLKAALPGSWYSYREQPKRIFTFAHGAQLLHKTTDDPESLRVGRVDFAFLNEAANMPYEAYQIALRATQDKGGCVLVATNRPRRTKGNWVTRLWQGAAKDEADGLSPAVKRLRCDPRLNSAISGAAKGPIERALRYAADEDEKLDEGLILEVGDFMYAPPFDEARHVRPLPEVGAPDITRLFTKKLTGRDYDFLLGADFQQQMAAAAFKVFGTPEEFRLWAVADWFIEERGDEDDLLDQIEADPRFTPESAYVIGDASGQWQKGDHRPGPVSFRYFRDRGWGIEGPQKKKSQKGLHSSNPRPVETSVARVHGLLSEDRLLVAPSAKRLPLALRKCAARKARYGNLLPAGIHAHLTDCVRYVVWWLLAGQKLVQTGPGRIWTATRGRM